MVRAQGGTPAAVRLGVWTPGLLSKPGRPARHRFRFRRDRATTCRASASARWPKRMSGSPCRTPSGLLRPGSTRRVSMPQIRRWRPGMTLGASYYEHDGWIDPPRNVLAYTVALFTSGVEVRERTAFTGLLTEPQGRVVGVSTSEGDIACDHVVLTGGPTLAAVGAAAGGRIWSGGVRHQVVVTEPHPGLAPSLLADGLRRQVGDLLATGGGRHVVGDVQPRTSHRERRRSSISCISRPCAPGWPNSSPSLRGLGLRRTWAATIDYTPDHLPLLGPLSARRRRRRRRVRRRGRGPRHDVGTGRFPGRSRLRA